MELALVFKILEKGLSIWASKEATKYLDQVIKLKKEWHKEYMRSDRSQLALDRIENELRIIAETFASVPGGKDE
jgi:hypothetical protein